jgi:hypothetical protein
MIMTILMAREQNSSNIASWIMPRVAAEPRIGDELYWEKLD